jgi:hypothetical protein
MRRPSRFVIIAVVGCLLAIAVVVVLYTPVGNPITVRIMGAATVEDRLVQDGPESIARWQTRCAAAGVSWPPSAVVLVACKAERVLEVHAAQGAGWVRVAAFPILAASGGPGPKLIEGDGQVPEGVYAIESLNPNSRFHRALRVGYPSAEDRRVAATDGRSALGGDIMIHGSSVSVGCLAMGDAVAQDLFVLAATVGVGQVQTWIAPCDLRRQEPPADPRPWVRERYADLAARMRGLAPAPSESRP